MPFKDIVEDKKKLSSLVSWSSIFLNTGLFVLKFWAGLVTGSIAIIADAWHTLSDSLSSIVVLIGVKISNKPADRDHPFGHGRAELIAATVVGIMLFIAAFEFIIESISKLSEKQAVTYGSFAVIATVISIVSKEIMAQVSYWAARKTGLKSIKADGWHHRTDAISSLMILGGIFLGRIYWWVDGVLGIAVSLMIAYAAFGILKDSMSSLLGEKPDKKLIDKITALAQDSTDYDIHLHHIHVHEYGDHREVTFHIRLPADMTIEEAHNIQSQIEQKLRNALGMHFTIHLDPR